MPDYTYYGFSLISGEVVTELPLRGATPSWQVNDPGDLGNPTINLSGLSATQLADIRGATVPWKCGVAVDRDGQIIWSGVITARRYASSGSTYSLTVPGLLTYWRRRFISTNLQFSGREQFEIVSKLLTYGDDPTVPLVIDNADSGIKRDRTIAAADFKAALDEILEIADNINGYEIAIATTWDDTPGAQRVIHRLLLGSPRLGNTDDGSGSLLTLEFPGNVRTYTWDEDGDAFASTIYGSSMDPSGVTVTRIMTNTLLYAEGFPQVGLVRQWSGITKTDTLTDHVLQALAEGNGYQDAPTFVVPDVGDTAAGSWTVGDDVRVRITDDRRFPVVDGTLGPGLDVIVRISSASVDPVARTVSMTMFGFTEGVQ